MSVNVYGGRKNKWDNINLNEEQQYSSKFQEATVNAGIASLKYLSPTDQVKMALGVMGKPAIDTANDAQLHNLVRDTQAELATMQAKYNALSDSLKK